MSLFALPLIPKTTGAECKLFFINKMKKAVKNQVQKLVLRQVRGSLQPFSRSNPVRFFTKYSQKCCFKLSDILDEKGEIRDGHVILGFTKDGTHLMSYSLVIDARLELPQPVYTYVLHWWKFRYCKPLVKVHSTHLFHKQPISHALYLIISQSLDEKQVIIWGRGPTSQEEQSCRCYVTVCAAPPAKPCINCKENPSKVCLDHCYAAHFMYDTLPPYPVFLPSVCLQIPGTIFINSGDSLVALKCVPCPDNAELENAIHDLKFPSKLKEDLHDGLGDQIHEENIELKNSGSLGDENTVDYMNMKDGNKENLTDGGKYVPNNGKEEIMYKDSFLTEAKLDQHDQSSDPCLPEVSSESTISSSSSGSKVNPKDYNANFDSLTKYSYRRYTTVQHSLLDYEDDINREVPILVMHGDEELQNSLCTEDYCTKGGITMKSGSPSVLVCQAFLDMEQCINELIESHEDLRHRYKSLRDYESQFLSVCNVTGDVMVMVKVLVYAKPTRSSLSEGLQLSPCPLLQQTGFVFSWNVWNGTLRTLHCLETLDHPQGKCFSKSESTVECARDIRQNITVPVGFTSQVRMFSNYTVFTEKSLKYLMHPFLPIIIIL